MKSVSLDDYLTGRSFSTYERLMSTRFPDFWHTFWFNRPDISDLVCEMNAHFNEFETDAEGGRGDSYRLAQQDFKVRAVGIMQLIKAACRNTPLAHLPSDYKILDVLGGDGVMTRCLGTHISNDRARHLILTSDIAANMVCRALDYGLPAVRQPAQSLLLKDNSYDAVLLAYGVHHIQPQDRVLTFREAFRVIKARGRIVVHDFEEGSPMAIWFREVVDRYSHAGHNYTHFTKQMLLDQLRAAGFRDVSVFRLYDPFIVVADSECAARNRLMDYVLNMYGLVKVQADVQNVAAARARVHCLVDQYLRYDSQTIKEWKPVWKDSLTVYQENDKYVAEIPRIALVAVASK